MPRRMGIPAHVQHATDDMILLSAWRWGRGQVPHVHAAYRKPPFTDYGDIRYAGV